MFLFKICDTVIIPALVLTLTRGQTPHAEGGCGLGSVSGRYYFSLITYYLKTIQFYFQFYIEEGQINSFQLKTLHRIDF